MHGKFHWQSLHQRTTARKTAVLCLHTRLNTPITEYRDIVAGREVAKQKGENPDHATILSTFFQNGDSQRKQSEGEKLNLLSFKCENMKM